MVTAAAMPGVECFLASAKHTDYHSRQKYKYCGGIEIFLLIVGRDGIRLPCAKAYNLISSVLFAKR